MTQTVKITITGAETSQKIKKVDLTRAKIIFLEYSDPNVSAYFDTSERVTIVGGSGEVTIKIFEETARVEKNV